MEVKESQQLECKRDDSLSVDGEAQMSGSSIKIGGWITFPFIMGISPSLSLSHTHTHMYILLKFDIYCWVIYSLRT